MKQLVTILFVLLAGSAFSHKFYISIADMEYDTIHNRINVSLKVTAHDFELVLQRKFERSIDLEAVSDSSEVNVYIKQYLKHNFKIYSQDIPLEMTYLGREVNERDELYFYFYFTDVTDPTTISIINKLLFSVSDQQQNIVHYKYLDRTKSVTLVASKSEDSITLQ